MESSDRGDGWVDAQLRIAQDPSDWQLDLDRAAVRLAVARRSHRRLVRIRVVTAGLAMAGLGVAGTWPAARVAAGKCVDACVTASARVGSMFGSRSGPATTPAGEAVEGFVAVARRLPAPDFSLNDRDGHRIRLSALRGQVVLLNFWATWCGPCRAEMPAFSALQLRHRDRGLSLVGISLDADGWTSVGRYLDTTPVTYPIVIGSDDVTARFGGIDALPTSLLIDRQGRIGARHVGLFPAGDYEHEIVQLLDEQP